MRLYTSKIEAKDGTQIPLFSDGKAMFSRYSPAREAENFASSIHTSGKNFFMICGLGNGIHIRAILARCPGSRFLVIENSLEDIAWLENNFQIQDLYEDGIMQVTTPEEISSRLKSSYSPAWDGDFLFLPVRSWADQQPAVMKDIRETVDRTLKEIASDMSTQAHFGKLWFRNFFLNLLQTQPCCQPVQLPNPADYNQALITAAGSSLETYIRQLTSRETRARVFLISTDTALPALLKQGVIPDLTVTIDGQVDSQHHFCLPLPKSMILAAEITSSPQVIRRGISHSCPLLLFRNNHPLPALLNQFLESKGLPGLPLIEVGAGTVTSAAVDIAYKLGFPKIQIAGADFAYINGKPYTRGTYLEDAFRSTSTRLSPQEHKYTALMFRSPTKNLGTQRTTAVLEEYQKALYEYLASYPSVSFITDDRAVNLDDAGMEARKPLLHPYTLSKDHCQEFISWYLEKLHKQLPEAISSISPLFIWYTKKNNDKSDIFRAMKLAYSQTVRYTEHYGK